MCIALDNPAIPFRLVNLCLNERKAPRYSVSQLPEGQPGKKRATKKQAWEEEEDTQQEGRDDDDDDRRIEEEEGARSELRGRKRERGGSLRRR